MSGGDRLIIGGKMYSQLEQELGVYVAHTPNSAAAHKLNLKRIPLGVASNYRGYEPYPIFVREAKGSHFYDLDQNDYVDHNLCFGAVVAGHSHPAIVNAVSEQLSIGTMLGMPHDLEWKLANEICDRFSIDMVRFGSTGAESTMHAIRLARAATGREKIMKFEGGYHGAYDAGLVSVKPHAPEFGDVNAPTSVPAGLGVPSYAVASAAVATFNNLDSVELRFKEASGEIAAIIVEPVMMNLGICMPYPGFLEGLREICTREGALLIFDEVKTGGKLSWGGASEYFRVKPDMICLGKSIGGGLPLSAFGGDASVMDLISQRKVFHGGTCNTNPVSMAAGLATFRDVLTRENYVRIERLGRRLVEGYRKTIAKVGLVAYVATAGANGALMLYPKEVRNYRDWITIDEDLWRHYWFGMVNRGVMPQPHWWDEQWTISVQHTEADIDQHLAAFEDVAPALAKAQQERMATQSQT
jgi:glutamate-1-semialdehyde 2,1-aminomutase